MMMNKYSTNPQQIEATEIEHNASIYTLTGTFNQVLQFEPQSIQLEGNLFATLTSDYVVRALCQRRRPSRIHNKTIIDSRLCPEQGNYR